MNVDQIVYDKLILDGVFVAGQLFIGHASVPDTDHCLIEEVKQREQTVDGVEKFIESVIRISVYSIQSVEYVNDKISEIYLSLVGVHVTANIIRSTLILKTSPQRVNAGYVGSILININGLFL